jgi:hypothetical protein
MVIFNSLGRLLKGKLSMINLSNREIIKEELIKAVFWSISPTRYLLEERIEKTNENLKEHAVSSKEDSIQTVSYAFERI